MKREGLTDFVGSGLDIDEREAGLSFLGKHPDDFEIVTYYPSMVRRLLVHPHATVQWVYIYKPDDQNERVEDLESYELADGAKIEGVKVTLPMGALTIKSRPRKSNAVRYTVSRDRHNE